MNILFLAQFPIEPNKGGVQRVTAILANEFQLLGCNVFFCSLDNQRADSLKQYDNQYHAFVNDIDSILKLITFLDIDVIINQAGVYSEVTKVLKGIKNALIGLRILTVHHNCISCLNERYKEIILGNPGVASKILSYIGSPALWNVLRHRNRFKYKRLFQASINVSDCLILLAKSYIRELTDLGVDDKGKVKAISNPASFTPQFSSLSHKENRIIFVGRLSLAQKRVDKLMVIIKDLHRKHQDWHFDVVGDGSERYWMEEYKSKNELVRVYFHGFCDPMPFLAKARILLLPSDFEGFGMVIPEAQAYGVVPVVTPCYSAVREVVGEAAGVVLTDSTINSMITAVDALIKSPSRLDAMAKKALKNVEVFNPGRIAAKWMDLIDSLTCE